MLDRSRQTFQGVAAVGSFVANLLPFRPGRRARSWWPLLQRVHEIDLVGKRFRRDPKAFDGRGMPLVYLALPTFVPPCDVPAAHRRQVDQEGQSPLYRPPAWHVPDERRPLDAGLGSLVSRWLDLPLPSVQVHSGPFTDRLLSTYHADAMTLGRDIYIKTEKFNPHSAAGLALLAHELTHVGQQLRGAGEAGDASPSRKEQTALENERLVLHHARVHRGPQNGALVPYAPGSVPADPPLGLLSSPTVSPRPGVASGATHGMESRSVTPMFADAARGTSAPEPVLSAPPIPKGLSDHDIARIKAEVYQDLMWRIKTEFERGS
jgi:hypothetical protein